MFVGHQKQWQFLKKLVNKGKIPHAFLFSGQAQIGKKKIALEFVKLLNCQEKNKPCQTCRNCQEIEKKTYPDLIFVSPSAVFQERNSDKRINQKMEVGKEIQISQIREVNRKISLKPYSAPFKTVIIDKAHLMTRAAQNCFLKTLEEPKGKAIFILITEYPQTLLATVISRCQILKFSPVPLAEIQKYLLSQGVSEERAKDITLLSSGKPGRAIELLDPEKIKEEKDRIKEIELLIDSDLISRFQYAKEKARKLEDLNKIFNSWLKYFRGILISTVNSSSDLKFKKYSVAKLKNILKLIQKTNLLISTTNVNPRLALEILMLEL